MPTVSFCRAGAAFLLALPMLLAIALLGALGGHTAYDSAHAGASSRKSHPPGPAPTGTPGGWDFPLWFQDPRLQLREAGQCMVTAPAASDCISALEMALRGNARNTQAALWLAQIYSHLGDDTQADKWLRYARERDRSFPAMLAVWQFHASEQENPLASSLDRDLILMAPPVFSGHYNRLFLRGWSAQALFRLLLEEGRSVQSRAFLQYLVETGDPQAENLLFDIIGERLLASPHTFPCSALVRQFVAQGLRGNRSMGSALRLWSAAIGAKSVFCEPSEEEVIADKRDLSSQDPVWNYNPSLRFPLVAQGFDWSAAQGEQVKTVPQAGGGVRFHFAGPAELPVILLARRLPSGSGIGSIRVATIWEPGIAEVCQASLRWEIRNPSGITLISRAQEVETGHKREGQQFSQSVSLALPQSASGLQLVLRSDPNLQPSCQEGPLAIRSVNVHATPHPGGQLASFAQATSTD